MNYLITPNGRKPLDYSFVLDEGSLNPAMAKDKELLSLDSRVSRNEKMKDDEELLKAIYKRYLPAIKKSISKFNKIVLSVVKDSKKNVSKKVSYGDSSMKKGDKNVTKAGAPVFKARVKPESSVINKVMKRGKKFSEMNDLYAATIALDTPEQVDRFVKDFKRKYANTIVAHDQKTKGSDPVYNYYGTHHFDVLVDGMIFELQVMTKKLSRKKDVAHQIYDRTRAEPGGPSNLDREISRKYYRRGNRNEEIYVEGEYIIVEGIKFHFLEIEEYGLFEEVDLELLFD